MKGDSSSVDSTLCVDSSNADTPDATTITDRPTATRTSSTSPTAARTRSPTNNSTAKINNDDSSSTLYLDWSDAAPGRKKSMNTKIKNDDSSSTLYLDWSDAATGRKKSMNTSNTSVSSWSLASTKCGSAATKNYAAAGTSSVIFQGLLREKEHTESTSSNRTLGGGFMRRNQSADRIATSKRHINVNTSRSGKRLSDLTTNSNWDADDDDDEKSINLEDANTDGQGEETASGSLGNLYQTNGGSSSRSILNDFISRAVKSSSNLAAMTEGLADEIGSRHKSNYLRSRVSVRVRRASDFLFSSHHRQGVVDDDVNEEDSNHYADLE